MIKKTITTLTVAAVLFTANFASAQVSSIDFAEVDNSGGGAELAGMVTNDILATFAGQYTGSQLIVDLEDGGVIYQNAINAGKGAPSAGLVVGIPATAFDTFVAQGSPTADGPAGNPSAGGGAVDLGGAAGAVFDTTAINQAWNPAGGQTGTSDQSDFLLARVTLSNTSNGTAHLLVSAAGARNIMRDIPVVNGVIGIVPEPTTLALCALGLVGIASTRRRS